MNEFDKRTALLPALIAQTVIDSRQPHSLSEAQQQFFCDFCDRRIRHLYKVNRKWRRQCNADGRQLCYAFVNHWLDAYLKIGNRIDRGYRSFNQNHPKIALDG